MIVHSVKRLWANIYRVEYTPPGNCGRHYAHLFFQSSGQWWTMEGFMYGPTHPAHPTISAALEQAKALT